MSCLSAGDKSRAKNITRQSFKCIVLQHTTIEVVWPVNPAAIRHKPVYYHFVLHLASVTRVTGIRSVLENPYFRDIFQCFDPYHFMRKPLSQMGSVLLTLIFQLQKASILIIIKTKSVKCVINTPHFNLVMLWFTKQRKNFVIFRPCS